MAYKVRSAVIHAYGPPQALQFEDQTVAAPGPGEAFVRNTILGLNFVDVYYRRGTFPVPSLPAVLGNEAVGVVEAIGSDVTSVKVGDRVVYSDDIRGAYTTGRLYQADRLTLIPDHITDEQAASAHLKGLTAQMLLKQAITLQAGDTVLYHAAAGGVGQIFSQWGKALGLRVIGTVSTPQKAEQAMLAGCDAVIDYSREDFVQKTRGLTDGLGVKAVFDSVGKNTFQGSLEALAPRGSLVLFGKASGDHPMLDPFALAPRSLRVSWPVLPVYVNTPLELATSSADLFTAIGQGLVRIAPSHDYSFEDIVEAHRDLEERRTTGAVILRI